QADYPSLKRETAIAQLRKALGRAIVMGLTILLFDGLSTPARATPRGKRPPRPAASQTDRVAAAQNTASVGVPSCRPRKDPLTYHGGPLVQNPHVSLLFWGHKWTSSAAHMTAKAQLEALFTNLGTSEYACAWREYAVPAYPMGAGTYFGSYVDSSDPPNPVRDGATIGTSDIKAEILALAGAQLPARGDCETYSVSIRSA